MIPLIGITIYFLLFKISTSLQCNPTESIKKVNPDDPYSYLYCNLEGLFTVKMCSPGSVFNTEKAECEMLTKSDDPLLQPLNQAPEDICMGGIPLTRLSAPVICNPSISSCPDGYVCNIYSKTGTAYCCKNPNFEIEENKDIVCPGSQVTYFDDNAAPKTCLLSKKGSCPSGFGCTLIGDTTTRCCGQSFGCPSNSAGLVNSMTGGFTSCDINDKKSWPHGFVCKKSNTFNNDILCSDTSTIANNVVCNGGVPLKRKKKCNKNYPCPVGFSCENEVCCPTFPECPVGEPLNKGIMKCSYKEGCPDGFDCITSNDATYCCPSSVMVCNLPKENGFICNNNASITIRYYFDRHTGTCKLFKFTQCGGNSNNFQTKEECENFCQHTQCPNGGIPHRQSSSNTYCSTLINQNINTCPSNYSCTGSILNTNDICCPIKEYTCNEEVTAGFPCFNKNISFLRFYFDSTDMKCKPFQYYGCNGNNNRFLSLNECEETCVLTYANVCNGMVPLIAPNHELAECSEDFPCPDGYTCNIGGNCCPEAQLACQTHVSLGSTCSKYKASKVWYWDEEHAECREFLFNGCGGTPNRFFSKAACLEACTKPVGECPSGMNPFRENGMVQECSLSIASSCPTGYSCVKSTGGVPICCQSVAKCPAPRKAYIIPGSDSFVACTPKASTCPKNYECVESDKVNGFFLCCSHSNLKRGQNLGFPSTRTLPSRQKVGEHLTCPDNLESNNMKCKINSKNACENGYTCMGVGINGVCCKGIPTCKRNLQAVFLAPKQVQLCGKGLVGCPRGSACAISSIKGVNVCCKTDTFFGNKKSLTPKCKGNKIPFYELGSRTAKLCEIGIKNTCPKDYICQETSDDEYHCCPAPDQCPNKGIAYIINGKTLACNIDVNNCPSGYKCEGDPETAICCKRPLDGSSCPDNRKVFTMAGRPLVCPKGSKTCPNGYSCVQSLLDDHIHVCCEDGIGSKVNEQPYCYQGEPYRDLFTQSFKECSREFNTCPVGFDCDESTVKGKWICCSTKLINKQYEGYCPIGQIPYVGLNSPEPPSCHMTLTPCPTSGAYTCVYSAQKQNSYCCAPIEAAVFMAPNKKLPLPEDEINNPKPNIEEEIGCPTGSKPFLEFGMPKRCSVLDPCPTEYACKQNKYDASVWQCCSNIIIIKPTNYDNENPSIINNNNNNQFNQFGGNNFYGNNDGGFLPNNNMNFLSPNKGGQLVLRVGMSSSDVEELDASKGCPNGFSAINNKCKKMYYLGQRGCEVDEQCSLTTQYAYCNKEYCACPHDKLIYNAKCVDSCPLGFLNIAGRCHDITTVMLMDSVDDRKNGTIGGFCLDTVVAEEQCLVKNSFCNEKSITCQCKPGFELEVNFDDTNDKGSCTEYEESKFTKERLNDYLKPHNQEPELFYVMEMRDDEEPITSKKPQLN